MPSAWTTAAVQNHSMNPPEKWASPLDYMPHYRQGKQPVQLDPELTEQQDAELSAYNVRVLEMAAKLKAQQHG